MGWKKRPKATSLTRLTAELTGFRRVEDGLMEYYSSIPVDHNTLTYLRGCTARCGLT